MDIPLSPMTPIEELSFTIVDVETTGLELSAGDRICEIALLRTAQGQETARFETLIQPMRPVTAGASAVNRITDAMLATAPLFAAVIPHLLPFLHNTVLVAHNASFDLSFLRHEFRTAGYVFPDLAVVDTLVVAQARYRFAHNSLAAIAAALGIAAPIQHRAMADVLTTWQVLQQFMTDLRQQGTTTLAQFMYPNVRRSPTEIVGLTTTLQEALQTCGLLRLRYQAGNAAETNRVVQPLEICYEHGHIYLRAFCHLRQDERNFRLDRIVTVQHATAGYATDGLRE